MMLWSDLLRFQGELVHLPEQILNQAEFGSVDGWGSGWNFSIDLHVDVVELQSIADATETPRTFHQKLCRERSAYRARKFHRAVRCSVSRKTNLATSSRYGYGCSQDQTRVPHHKLGVRCKDSKGPPTQETHTNPFCSRLPQRICTKVIFGQSQATKTG